MYQWTVILVYEHSIINYYVVPILISVNVITVITILAAIMCCYILRTYIKTSKSTITAIIVYHLSVSTGAAKGPLQDVVSVSDNPAYQMVIIQRINRTDETQLKETASIAGHQSTVTSPQYENIPGVDIKNKVAKNNNSVDDDDYEKVE